MVECAQARGTQEDARPSRYAQVGEQNLWNKKMGPRRDDPHWEELVWIAILAPLLLCIFGVIVEAIRAEQRHRLEDQQLAVAQSQVEDWYRRLPQIQNFTTLSTTLTASYWPENAPCPGATAVGILGANSTVTEALNVYSDALRSSGWQESPSNRENGIERIFDHLSQKNIVLRVYREIPPYLELNPAIREW